METLFQSPALFPPGEFIETAASGLNEQMEFLKRNGAVFGASGGIDSLVTATLCVKARGKGRAWPVIGLQMNDSRVKGEHYRPEAYQELGVDLIQMDITEDAIETEKRSHMPPRWLTVALMKFVLRRLPTALRRRLILQVISGQAPKWSLSHFRLLTLLHRLRIARLREFAASRNLMVVICANRTEASLGYFVEQGVDDTRMGDWAPISNLYKTQVIAVARYLGFPAEIIRQRPSPGFGAIYDEEILGPYELVDQILTGIDLGYSVSRLARWVQSEANRFKVKEVESYVRFLRELSRLAAGKGPGSSDRTF